MCDESEKKRKQKLKRKSEEKRGLRVKKNTKTKKKQFSDWKNVSVPTGHEGRKFNVPGSKKRATGTRARSKTSPIG